MANVLQVFVSSMCYELRDLRAAVRDFLTNLGIVPQLSNDPAFPRVSGEKPYVTCLRTLEECPLVIGLLERKYGQPFADWGAYPEYNDLSPTHAELRHTLKSGKKLLLYVHESTMTAYHQWKTDPAGFSARRSAHDPEIGTLNLLHELKTADIPPWIEGFKDASDVLRSLNGNLVNEIYASLRDQEQKSRDFAEYLTEQIRSASPEIRSDVQAKLNPELLAEINALKLARDALEENLAHSQEASRASIEALKAEKASAEARIAKLDQQARREQMMLTLAAVRDVRWLELVRTTLMPRQPSRIPFHNSAEVALRGFHAAAGGRQKPMLREVTWSKLPDVEGGLHRGCKAGIIFKGGMFTPGVTWTHRRRGETGPPTGNDDYIWRLPNIYFGDYLEVSSADDAVEGPLSWRDHEFQVKNPEGEKSDWVLFTYPFDDGLLTRVRDNSSRQGNELLAAGKAAEAIEPLRKAYVFSDRMLGIQHEVTLRAKFIWERARDEAALAKLRFRVNDQLTVTAGPHAGKHGVVVKLLLNHLHAYVIKPAVGDEFQASDAQVDRAISD